MKQNKANDCNGQPVKAVVPPEMLSYQVPLLYSKSAEIKMLLLLLHLNSTVKLWHFHELKFSESNQQ